MARFEGSKTPLLAAGEWSTILVAGREDYVVGLVFADQAGTLHIEQSTDQTNWDVDTTYAIVASNGKGFKEEIFAPYVRVRFTNGATPQGTFRITTRFSSAGMR